MLPPRGSDHGVRGGLRLGLQACGPVRKENET